MDRFSTIVEVAELLKVAPTTVRNLVKSGEIRAFTVGQRGEFRIEKDALEEYIAAAYTWNTAPDDSNSSGREAP